PRPQRRQTDRLGPAAVQGDSREPVDRRRCPRTPDEQPHDSDRGDRDALIRSREGLERRLEPARIGDALECPERRASRGARGGGRGQRGDAFDRARPQYGEPCDRRLALDGIRRREVRHERVNLSGGGGLDGHCGIRNYESVSSAPRLGPTTHAMTMLRQYSASIGAAKIACVIMSPVGVMTAATMKMISSAYLNCLS